MDNMTETFCTKSTCCIESTGRSINPADVSGTVKAGCVGRKSPDLSCTLAKIYFPDQKYVAGYEPGKAQYYGTLFPELVRLYE